MLSIPALFRPAPHQIPVAFKDRVLLCEHRPLVVQLSHYGQLKRIVGVDRFHSLLVRELATACFLGDASLQSALNGIASQLERAVKQSQLEQRACLLQPNF